MQSKGVSNFTKMTQSKSYIALEALHPPASLVVSTLQFASWETSLNKSKRISLGNTKRNQTPGNLSTNSQNLHRSTASPGPPPRAAAEGPGSHLRPIGGRCPRWNHPPRPNPKSQPSQRSRRTAAIHAAATHWSVFRVPF